MIQYLKIKMIQYLKIKMKLMKLNGLVMTIQIKC